MKKSDFVSEDWEKEATKEEIYLQEKECEQWLSWHEEWRRQEGIVILEEEEEIIETI